MRFETTYGIAMSARQACHDAYMSGVGSIDMREVLNSFGVQYSAKGGDNCTMEHCDKGKIQQSIHNLKMTDEEAWAWIMFAYAPDGTENKNKTMNILFKFAMNAVKTEKFNPLLSVECGRLATVAVHHAAIEGRTDKRHYHKWKEMAALCKCSLEEYEEKWMGIFFKMKDSVRDLDRRALPPVATVVWLIIDKQAGDLGASDDLMRAMKTNREAA